MNPFLSSAVRLIKLHGKVIPYTSITRTIDKVLGTVVETKTTYNWVMYPKSVKVNQYNYPDLVGKNVIIFYLANNALAVTPKVNDTITFNGQTFVVRSLDFHEARGENCVYRITGATG